MKKDVHNGFIPHVVLYHMVSKTYAPFLTLALAFFLALLLLFVGRERGSMRGTAAPVSPAGARASERRKNMMAQCGKMECCLLSD